MKHLKMYENFFSAGDPDDRNMLSKQLIQRSENKPGMVLIATNDASWSWEYDSTEKTARIFVDTSGKLFLEITEMHTKSGIGAGIDYNTLVGEFCGTINKPDLGSIRTILKKNTIQKSSSGRGFKAKWTDKQGNEFPLTEIINNYKSGTWGNYGEKPMSEVSPRTRANIELVPYSDKSFALFGSGTITLKGELLKLGGHYNRWLVDPKNKNTALKTGDLTQDYYASQKQTKPGWIFPNSKLAQVKELIGENYKFTAEDIRLLKQYIHEEFTPSDVVAVFPSIFDNYFDVIVDDADLDYMKTEDPDGLGFDIAYAVYVYCHDYNDNNYFIRFLNMYLEKNQFRPGAGQTINYESLEDNSRQIYEVLTTTAEDTFYIMLEKNLNPVTIARDKFGI